MNKILMFFVCLILFLTFSCRMGEKEKINVSIYYNPSGTFFSDQQHLKVTVSNNVIIDTVFNNNTHIDKSKLIRDLRISKEDLKNISIKVNNIDTVLEDEDIGKCVAFFISYNDHEGLFNEINKRGLNVTDDSEKFNKTLDSLRIVLGRKLHKVKVSIKHDYCESN